MTIPPAPEPDAPEAQRVAYFARYAPVARIIEIDASSMRRMPQRESWLQLRNGAVVSDAADLIPAVGEHAATAEAAHEATVERQHALPWLVAGGAVVGVAAVTAGFVPVAGMPAFLLSAGVLALSLPPFVVGAHHMYAARNADERAFQTYGDDLLRRLGLRADARGRLFEDPDVPPAWRDRASAPPAPRGARTRAPR